MNFTQFDSSLSVSGFLAQLTGSPNGAEDLTARIISSIPSASVLMAAGTTAAVGYALWEQIKFRMYKAGKNGTSLAGMCGDRPMTMQHDTGIMLLKKRYATEAWTMLCNRGIHFLILSIGARIRMPL